MIGPVVSVALASGDRCRGLSPARTFVRDPEIPTLFLPATRCPLVESKPSEVEGVENPVSCSGKTSEGSWKGGMGHLLLGGGFLAGGQFPRAQYKHEVVRRGWGSGSLAWWKGTGGERAQEEQGAGSVLVRASVVQTRGCTQCGGRRTLSSYFASVQ